MVVQAAPLRPLTGPQGGTGIGTTTVGSAGLFLQVASTSPFLTYTFAAASGGGGGSGNVGTSTINYFSFYNAANTVTGTSAVQFINGILTIATTTSITSSTITYLNVLNTTSTNLTLGLTGYLKGNGISSPVTAAASIPNTDVSGLGTMSTQNANAVAITGGTAVFTSLTSTNAFFTNVSSTNATTTNLSVSGAVSFTNALGATSGGTGLATYVLGDTLYASAANTLARLAGNTSTQQLYLAQTGDGSNSLAPSWQPIPSQSVFSYYFYDTSATTTYKLMQEDATSTKVNLTTAAVTDGMTLANWITPTGTPGISVIPDGLYEFKINAKQSAGVQVTQLVGQFWETDQNGTDIALIGASATSSILTGSETAYTLFFNNTNAYALASASSRILLRVKAVVTLVGTAPTDILSYGGTADSHIEFPGITVDASNFVPYSGATGNVTLGTNSFTTNGLTFTSASGSNVTTTNLFASGQLLINQQGTFFPADFTSGQTIFGIAGSSTGYIEGNIENFASGTASQACWTASQNTGTPTTSFAALCANNSTFNSTTLFYIGAGNDQSLMFNTIGNGYVSLVSATGTLYFTTGNTTTVNRMSIDSGGNITLIGTSTITTTTIAKETVTTSTITYLNATTVTSSNFIVSGVTSQCLQTDSNGKITGTGSACGSGGAAAPGIVATSTANYFTYYLSATTVTGTSFMQNSGAVIAFTTGTTFTTSTITYLNFQNATGTQLNLASNSVLCFGTAMVSTTGECIGDNSGQLYVSNTVLPNQTSTYQISLSEPSGFSSITAANTTAVYSDDIGRMFEFNTGLAGNATLRTGSFVNATQIFGSLAAAQQIGVDSFVTGGVYNGIVTYQGYHYLVIASSSPFNGTLGAEVMRATSTSAVELSSVGSYVTSTISGAGVTSTNKLVGASTCNGSPTLWFVSSTTVIVPYTINVANNTLTAGTPLTITSAGMSLTNTRVNDNGIWAGGFTAPSVRLYSCAGVKVPSMDNIFAGNPSATGPDFFVMRFSQYALQGATSYISRFFVR